MKHARTVIVDNGEQQAIVGEHPDLMYLSVGGIRSGGAMFLNPIHALEVAAALIGGASAIIERQFQQRVQGG